MSDDVDGVTKDSVLISNISIPDAASSLMISADLRRRTLNLSMSLKAPTDRKRATASINWLLRQLRDVEREDLLIRADWPRRLRVTTGTITDVRNDPACLIHEGVKDLPKSFEIVRVIDLAGKFSGVKTFVEYTSKELPLFYKDVGEHLRAWVPPPPRLKQKIEDKVVTSKISNGTPDEYLKKDNDDALPITSETTTSEN